ncbi:PREDICTED: cadherin-related family member 2 [Crocodylus porosus]|uniref:Cadherin-related family member 2 n=1 Tax=Crocodylus porosus TaxID=8502 RepID=A0A7M4F4I6_CROPO|nr:PREDICTED: cadherin-related family member 2 [Crocodylus porosus]
MAWRPPLLLLLPWLVAAVSGNMAPVFNMTSVVVPEDLLRGAVAFVLTAYDADGDPLHFGLEGADAFYFSVNANTGSVTLVASLDRETKPRLSLNVLVSDGKNQMVTKRLTVIVEDRNDNRPLFQNEPYMADVPENVPNGTTIINVLAEDKDSGPASHVSYQIVEVTPNNAKNHDLFRVLGNGTVLLNGLLNYMQQSTYYLIRINATDGGGQLYGKPVYQTTSTSVSVNVLDQPDLDPQFLNEPYVGSVPENCPLGTSVLTVSAMDRDTGVNDVILYSLTNTSLPFAINNTTGTITVTGALDRESLPSDELLLEVLARERNLDIHNQPAQARATVTVRVTDINDNRPQFYRCVLPHCDFTRPPQHRFEGHIAEHASARLPVANLNIVARDPDKGSNGTFELSLQGRDAAAFSVLPSRVTGEGEVQLLVQNPVLVDYERVPEMTVEIIANDTRNPANCCSVATVTIRLEDINDHSPTFNQSVYKLYVMENSPTDTVISRGIMATDPDTGAFGNISYQLLPESIQDIFAVNAVSGEVLVRNGSLLDREMRAVYYATLQATDGAHLTGSTLLEITLEDDNDNDPVVTGTYKIFVVEGQENVSVQIQAYDNDEPGTNNSRLRFTLEPGPFSANFTIDPDTGLLRSLGPLDREALNETWRGQMGVTVRVQDSGQPLRSTLVNVTITVEDVNDNAPVFIGLPYKFEVQEHPAGGFVGSVEAMDADQTDVNQRISFVKNGSGSSNFLLRSHCLGPGHYQGLLSLDPDVPLDYEQLSQPVFNLTVLAQNTATDDTLTTVSTVVQVVITDINDEPPTIQPSPLPDARVAENSTGPQPELLTTVQASDPDTNHTLSFQELGLSCYKGGAPMGSVCHGWFHLAPNGSVFANRSEIDYEACDLARLTLRVHDNSTVFGSAYSQNETLRIIIEDANDNSPEFLPIKDTFVVIPDLSPMDLQVAVVKAWDMDTGPRGVITFAIRRIIFIQEGGLEHTLDNLFKVVTSAKDGTYVGSIQVASNLDGSLKGQYRVTVEAMDGAVPVLSTQAVLDIFTVDQSYRIRLQFRRTVDEVQGNTEQIKIALTAATKTTVYVAAIRALEGAPASRSARAAAHSVMEAYFIYSNGTALDFHQFSTIVQSDPQALTQLVQLGLAVIDPGETAQTDKQKELVGVIAGLAGALALLILLMAVVLVSSSRSYRRKLTALKALQTATTLAPDTVQQGPAIPGTNKYNAERANPVLNLALSLDEDDRDSSLDSTSVNSLDENAVDVAEEGSAMPRGRVGASAHTDSGKEPLAAALWGHRAHPSTGMAQPPGASSPAVMRLSTPSLDTTDL